MIVQGTLKFTADAEESEKGGKRMEGDYAPFISGLDMPLKTDVILAKDDAARVISLGGITTVNFLHIKAEFDDDSVADANIEVIVSDGAGDRTITCNQFMLVDTDITSLKLTNNSHDTTGSAATVFIDLAGV